MLTGTGFGGDENPGELNTDEISTTCFTCVKIFLRMKYNTISTFVTQ